MVLVGDNALALPRLLFAGLILSLAAGPGPGAVSARADGVELATAKHLAPPKGRVRKLLMDPSISPGRRGYGPQAFKWFWKEVSSSSTAASAARWAEVMRVIERGRASGKAVFGSRAAAARILRDYRPLLEREAKRRKVSLPLLIAVIAVESNGNRLARSPKGARGLMQLMPGTARRFGVANTYTPAQNIRGGAHYLDWLLRYFKDDAVLALAGYNAGEGAVIEHRGVPPFAETRDYVAKGAGAYAAARTLCKSPPRSPREPCVVK